MRHSLFKEGGPHNVKRTGLDNYTYHIAIQPDEHGRVARECPNPNCSPGYYKVKNGTGITENHETAFCPYCRTGDDPSAFMTKEQIRYGKEIITQDATKAFQKMMRDSFGIGPSGKKKIGGGPFSVEISMESERLTPPRSPFEEKVLRAVICPHCGLDHAVYGLAIWCPDCGKDIFMSHVEEEFKAVKTMLGDVDRRREELGARIAARDLENCLEDTVSIFEAVLKALLTRYLRQQGQSDEEIQEKFKKEVRTRFQNPKFATDVIQEQMQQSLFKNIPLWKVEKLLETFKKRHPITHNLGVIDRKYIEKALAAEREGKEIRVTKEEILESIEISFKALSDLYSEVFQQSSSD